MLKTEHDFDMARESVMRVLREHFRPEFLNRVDDIVIFRPLGHAQMSQILELRLNEVRKLLEDRQISLELTESARQLILAAGSDAAYGARPLKRALQRMVQDPLAIKILDGEVLHGAHVRIDVDRNSNQLRLRADGPRSHGVRVKRGAPSKLCLGGGGVQLSTEIRRLLSHPKRSRLRNV